MEGSDGPGGDSGVPGGGSGGPGGDSGGPEGLIRFALGESLKDGQSVDPFGWVCGEHSMIPKRFCRVSEPYSWDNYKGLPMLELWTARTRSREEPQMQH